MSTLTRWRSRLAARRQLEYTAKAEHTAASKALAGARRRDEHPRTAKVEARDAASAKLKLRRRQVAAAERVIARHQDVGISATALRAVAPWITDARAAELAAALGPAFARYGITTPRRAAAAVAQMAHESAGFRTTTEYASGAAYEGRHDLGNTHPGDGARFRGRGLIQVTGRHNYAAASRAFGVNFLAHPEKLAEPKYAALVSCWWWSAHGCNELADRGDFTALTRRINGGTNGLNDRINYWHRAQNVAPRLVPNGAR